ncbi:ABC transporter ATP-binding protein [Rhizobium leguminosarum]|uniref:ABC transporter ATP-binding protein n=1 Tax=Rhizobium leguminosarum TaxID=384 RepID=UPI00143F5890|nr:ABC transporter ATP-binding protein [Rhizobium leguminosarum]NKL21247.1 ATP-binding cassette domain-containing protein [Rhizobium leguminosarum bv. viciae]NKL56754.1 ATP-binding cassette domain-containing protein [Rhizobium leguminosarum bv. viciae]
MNNKSTLGLAVRALSKSYGYGDSAVQVLKDITFDVHIGEFVCVVGPSGAGKTTLLRCLTSLMPLTSGEVLLDGEKQTGPSPKISIVFQEYTRSLMPWMTAEKNVALALHNRKLPKAQARQLSREALVSVGLEGSEERYPWQMSGGMQQRVAIARALVTEPEVLVMDEPFASIDAQTKLELEDLTLSLQRARNMTVMLVTHDIDEAVYLSDRIVVLSKNPASVQEIVAVDLGKERDQFTTRESHVFGELRSHVLGLIRHSQAQAKAKAAA